jgi:hypothetical protein
MKGVYILNKTSMIQEKLFSDFERQDLLWKKIMVSDRNWVREREWEWDTDIVFANFYQLVFCYSYSTDSFDVGNGYVSHDLFCGIADG